MWLKRQQFLFSILRPWVLVRPELNSRPPASQPNAQQQRSHRCAVLNENRQICHLDTDTGLTNRALVGHSFKNFTVNKPYDSHLLCFVEKCRCQAYQMKGKHSCELLDEDRFAAPDDFVEEHTLWPYCFNYWTQHENDRKTSCLEGVWKGYLCCQKWYIQGRASGRSIISTFYYL